MITYAVIAVVILALVGYIIRWWNLPKTIEARRLAQESRARATDERREDRIKKLEARRASRKKP